MNFYGIAKCDYCGEDMKIVRCTPFMADRTANMCKHCWNETKKEYATCNDEYIPNFDSQTEDYEKIKKEKNKIITKEKTLKVDISIRQTPVSANYECPHCEEEIEIDYQDFCNDVGEQCDWQYTDIECPNCGKTIEIDSVDWD